MIFRDETFSSEPIINGSHKYAEAARIFVQCVMGAV